MPPTGGLRRLVAEQTDLTALWCTLPHHAVAEALAAAGHPVIVIDLQHGHVSWDTLPPLIYAIERAGCAPVVRIAWSNPESAIRALDVGASGVVAPMIDTADDARRLASWLRYPPNGERSYSPNRWNRAGVEQADQDAVCIPMIETVAGLRNVEDIAAVQGVDGLFLGPADLALSLGIPLGTPNHPQLLDAIDTTVAAARRHGLFVASTARDRRHADDLFERGVRLVTLGTDVGFITAGAKHAAQQHDPAREAQAR